MTVIGSTVLSILCVASFNAAQFMIYFSKPESLVMHINMQQYIEIKND